MLGVELSAGNLTLADQHRTYAECGYRYALAGQRNDQAFVDGALLDLSIDRQAGQTLVSGRFAHSGLVLTQRLRAVDGMIEETITLRNPLPYPVQLESVEFGFLAALEPRPEWQLVAIPFRVQLDGSVHDYTSQALHRRQIPQRRVLRKDASRAAADRGRHPALRGLGVGHGRPGSGHHQVQQHRHRTLGRRADASRMANGCCASAAPASPCTANLRPPAH